jgi:DtxR family Mn-dependent transcriptional regulator
MRYERFAEEYVEIVAELLKAHPVARVKEIAEARGVTLPTVTSAVNKLTDLGLLKHEHYSYVSLTPQGEDLARELEAIHRALKELLTMVLGVEEAIAEADACTLEHFISPQTQEGLVKLRNFLKDCPEGGVNWLKQFHQCRFFTFEDEDCEKCQLFERNLKLES